MTQPLAPVAHVAAYRKHQLDELFRRADAQQALHDRAWKIVDRVLPELPTAHGFYQPHAFVASARRSGDRKYLEWMVFARLRAKAEGGEPFIAIPKNCEHLWRPGDTMFDAAQNCNDPAVWDRLRSYIAEERKAA